MTKQPEYGYVTGDSTHRPTKCAICQRTIEPTEDAMSGYGMTKSWHYICIPCARRRGLTW